MRHEIRVPFLTALFGVAVDGLQRARVGVRPCVDLLPKFLFSLLVLEIPAALITPPFYFFKQSL